MPVIVVNWTTCWRPSLGQSPNSWEPCPVQVGPILGQPLLVRYLRGTNKPPLILPGKAAGFSVLVWGRNRVYCWVGAFYIHCWTGTGSCQHEGACCGNFLLSRGVWWQTHLQLSVVHLNRNWSWCCWTPTNLWSNPFFGCCHPRQLCCLFWPEPADWLSWLPYWSALLFVTQGWMQWVGFLANCPPFAGT